MIDLDSIVIEAQLKNGANPEKLMADADAIDRQRIARVATMTAATNATKRQRNPNWTDEELDFLRTSLGHLSLADIGEKLGRSKTAVKIKWTRMGYPAPSKREVEMTAHRVSEELGMCGKKIIRMIDEGRMPGRTVPTSRNIHVVNKKDLLRWLCQPINWVYIMDVERIQNPQWRSLVKRKMEAWGDEWWTTGQVGSYHGVSHSLVNKHIRKGWLPGVRWQNWLVLKSDAIKHRFKTGRGSNTIIDWNPEAEAFMLLARAVGYTHSIIDALCDYPSKRSEYRTKYLQDKGRVPHYIKRYDLPIQHGPKKDGRMWADWHDCKDRFPGLVRAIDRFLQQRPLCDSDQIRGVLQSWASWFAEDDETRAMAHRLKYNANRSQKTLWEIYQRLKAKGIDPFGDVA